jgi:hypothetical protein
VESLLEFGKSGPRDLHFKSGRHREVEKEMASSPTPLAQSERARCECIARRGGGKIPTRSKKAVAVARVALRRTDEKKARGSYLEF